MCREDDSIYIYRCDMYVCMYVCRYAEAIPSRLCIYDTVYTIDKSRLQTQKLNFFHQQVV